MGSGGGMTVIAWDGRTLAADKRATNQGLIRTVTKIRRIGQILAAGSGDFGGVGAAFAWVEAGRPFADYPTSLKDGSTDLLLIDAGRILKYEKEPHPMTFEDDCYAMGTGRDYAMAAMHLGYGAERAVEVACALDNSCGNGVDTLMLDNHPVQS